MFLKSAGERFALFIYASVGLVLTAFLHCLQEVRGKIRREFSVICFYLASWVVLKHVRNLAKTTQNAIDQHEFYRVGVRPIVSELKGGNTRTGMIGVILWSDAPLQKAVIWCEDQGDLAFFKNNADADSPALNPGDWVEFDLTLSGNFRIAENLSVLAEQGSPDLASRLSAAGDCCSVPAANAEKTSTVVPFPTQAAVGREKQAALQAQRG